MTQWKNQGLKDGLYLLGSVLGFIALAIAATLLLNQLSK